jgi:hypothetical protein
MTAPNDLGNSPFTNDHVTLALAISMLMIMIFNLIDCMDMIVGTVFSGMLVLTFMNNIGMGVFMRVPVAVFMQVTMGVFVRVDLVFVRMLMIVLMGMGMLMSMLVFLFFFHDHILL